jgi:hypothetical protein
MFYSLQGCILSAMPQDFLNCRQDTSGIVITLGFLVGRSSGWGFLGRFGFKKILRIATNFGMLKFFGII